MGSCETRTADVRIVAATHRDLEEEVRAGRFREDLFFRLNVVPIQLPPLRERMQDLPQLIDGFHEQLELRGHAPVKLTTSAVQALRCYEWPGNVRELQNLLERLSVLQPGEQISATMLPERYRQNNARDVDTENLSLPLDGPLDGPLNGNNPPALAAAAQTITAAQGLRLDLPVDGIALKDLLTGIERKLIQQALARSGGVVSQAARLLGLGRTTLLEKIRKLQLN